MPSFTATHKQALMAIVNHLPGWRLETRLDKVYDHTAELLGPGGAMLNIRAGKAQKWDITGQWPRSQGWHSFSINVLERDHPYQKISLSPSRRPSAIAADIKRRIMPHYLDGLAKVNAYLKRRAQEKQDFEVICHTVTTHLPVKPINYQRVQGQTTFYFADCNIKGNLNLQGKSGASLELTDLSIEQVFAIVNLLKKESSPC